ncbi:MAG: polysaccharide export protein [Candidatus Eisenbacteria bacterium]|nr:polysaccharide export protein [Candidatus Eisenbacteria bacterium]
MRRFPIILSASLVFWMLSLPFMQAVAPVLPCFTKTVGIFAPSFCEAADEPEYVIGPSDVLSVVTRERPDLSGTFIVTPEGTIAFSLLGDVKAAGLTPSQLSKDLSRRLAVFRVNETVVTVVAYNSRKIFVIGEVAKPGKYTFSAIPSIWDVLSEAGGPTAGALLNAVQIIRAGTGETITVDVRRMLSGDAREQVKLQPGDTIRVPSRTTASPEGYVIYILGEVKMSGTYDVAMVRDLVGAVVASGGPTETADLKKVTIVRRAATASTVFKVNLEKFLKEGLTSGNPDLRSGDTITVPRKRSVLGTVFSFAGLATLLSAAASVVIIAGS